MTEVVLIRHAEARGNVDRVFQGHTDAEISQNGWRQLERLAERCKDERFGAIYASPLKRTIATAEAVVRHHRLALALHPGLIEINGGILEGTPWKEFPRRFPDEAKLWNLEPWRFSMEGGESMREVYDRMWETITAIVKAEWGKRVALVSHGCAIRCFLCRASGLPITSINDIEWADNTAMSVVRFDEKMRPKVVSMNDRSHLGEDLSTLAKQQWWKSSARQALKFE